MPSLTVISLFENNPLALLVLAGCLFFCPSCLQKETFRGVLIDPQTAAWIDGFDVFAEGDTIPFSNGGVVTVKKRFTNHPLGPLVDCRINGVVRQCENEVLTLQLGSPFDENNYHLTFYLFPTIPNS